MREEAECVDRGREAHEQLLRLAKVRAAVDAEIAKWLLVAERERVHIALGYGTFVEYVERTLGYRPRTTLDRLRVAEALERLPELKRAVADGDVAYSAARELTRFVEPETEQAWIGAVAGKTVREVIELAAGREAGDLPDDRQKPAVTMRRLGLELRPEDYALWVQARRVLEEDADARLDDGDVIAALCRRLLDGGAVDGTRARHQIAMTRCRDCARTTQEAAGQIIDVAGEAYAAAACDATYLDLDRPHARATKDIPDRIREHVERRDQLRCAFPGCRSSHELHIHHICYRAHGGTHDPGNLVLVCGNHHRAIHDGRVRVSGTAPHCLRFEHADGRPYGAPDIVEADPPRARVSTLEDLSAYLQSTGVLA